MGGSREFARCRPGQFRKNATARAARRFCENVGRVPEQTTAEPPIPSKIGSTSAAAWFSFTGDTAVCHFGRDSASTTPAMPSAAQSPPRRTVLLSRAWFPSSQGPSDRASRSVPAERLSGLGRSPLATPYRETRNAVPQSFSMACVPASHSAPANFSIAKSS
jgi:hypothetical protein